MLYIYGNQKKTIIGNIANSTELLPEFCSKMELLGNVDESKKKLDSIDKKFSSYKNLIEYYKNKKGKKYDE